MCSMLTINMSKIWRRIQRNELCSFCNINRKYHSFAEHKPSPFISLQFRSPIVPTSIKLFLVNTFFSHSKPISSRKYTSKETWLTSKTSRCQGKTLNIDIFTLLTRTRSACPHSLSLLNNE